MGRFKVGLIRVLTTEDQDVLQAHGKVIMENFPGIDVETKCIPDQYEGIHNDENCRDSENIYRRGYVYRQLCRRSGR